MKWIKCSDRLPKFNQEILCINDNQIFSAVYTYTYKDKSDEGFYDRCCWVKIDNVTHWMPRPNLPISMGNK